jgi:hypothetical protein
MNNQKKITFELLGENFHLVVKDEQEELSLKENFSLFARSVLTKKDMYPQLSNAKLFFIASLDLMKNFQISCFSNKNENFDQINNSISIESIERIEYYVKSIIELIDSKN